MSTGIQTVGLAKQYGPTTALAAVDFHVQAGEVCALMGRNGAGKSTLVRILSGNERPDSGEVLLDGEPVTFHTPEGAIKAGIATVHQEIAVIEGLTVAENVLLGRWGARAGFLTARENARIASEALEMLGVQLDLNQPAGELRVAEQQLIEIARALSYKPRILILDEPTSSLTEWEAERLASVVRRLAGRGVGIVYVSHRMKEIAKVADRVSVLRDGRIVADLPIAEADIPTVAGLMAGEELVQPVAAREATRVEGAPVALRAEGVATRERLHDVSLEVRRGEILGLAGRLGAGRTEILRALAGIDRRSAGTITGPDGRELPRASNPRRNMASGIALVPENRRAEGAVLNQPILHNLVMSCLDDISRALFINARAERELGRRAREDTHLKAASLHDPVSSLSGGNQQKVVFGRCINAGVKVLLLDEPTRGVDIQAKQQVFQLVHQLADEGCAVIVVSSEYGELVENCHRLLLVDDGTVLEELPRGIGLDALLAKIMRPSESELEHAS